MSTLLLAKDRWGKRYKETLNSIKTPYVLTFLEDFVFTEPVKTPALLEDIIDFMEKHKDVTVVYLDAFPKWCFVLEESEELPGFGKMPQVCSYKLSTAIAVWRRERLVSLIEDFETPWEWEVNASFRACRQYCGEFYAAVGALKDISQNVMFSIPFGGAIRRGLWNTETEHLVKKYKLPIDLSMRGIMDADNPFREMHIEHYSLKDNFRKDIFKTVFWKNVVSHGKIRWETLYSKFRFLKSVSRDIKFENHVKEQSVLELNKDRLTIVVNSCDAYADVWDLFFEAMRVQWPQCPYNIVLNTEKKDYSYKDMPITVHKCGGVF